MFYCLCICRDFDGKYKICYAGVQSTKLIKYKQINEIKIKQT